MRKPQRASERGRQRLPLLLLEIAILQMPATMILPRIYSCSHYLGLFQYGFSGCFINRYGPALPGYTQILSGYDKLTAKNPAGKIVPPDRNTNL
jgi:hypothetical protein